MKSLKMYQLQCVDCKHKHANCHQHCLVYKITHLRRTNGRTPRKAA